MKIRTWKWLTGLTAVLAVTACDTWKQDPPKIGTRHQTTAALRNFESCEDLQTTLRQNLSEEMRAQLLQMQDYYGRWGGMESDAAAPSAGATNDSSGGTRTEGVDYSGTNNQETGVDEADFVKTDGYYIYTLNGNRLEILGVPQFGELTYLSGTEVEGYPGQMLIDGNRVIVYSQIYTWNLPEDHPLRAIVGEPVDGYGWWYPSQVLTKLTVLDVSDRSAPVVLRQLYMEGYYQTARKVDSSVRMVAYSWMDIPGLRYYPELPQEYYELNYEDPRREDLWNEAVVATIRYNDALIAQATLGDFIPQIYEAFASGAFVEHSFTTNQCRSFAISDDGMGRGVNSILSLDLLGDTFTFDADHIIANWSQVYASTDTLLLAEPSWDWWWFWDNDEVEESTNIHRFDIGVAGQTRYTGSGRVRGLIRNQFSLSEHDDYVRVASTTGQFRWWSETETQVENHVTVLAGADSLVQVGHVGGIALGESIWAARFVGNRGYLVTFRNIDPLWTIDMSRPTQPVVVGELEVPGVSTYIHPFGSDKLLTIGYGGDDSGMDWSTQVSLFDVSDFAHPSRSAALSLSPDVVGDGWTWAWSEATWEHKAFQYWGPMSMLAIPLSTYRSIYDANGHYDSYEYKSQLALIRVDAEGTTDALPLSRYDQGQIDHSAFFNSDPNQWWDWRDVRRSIFMGDFIYAISDRGVTAHRVSDLTLSASVPLEGSNFDYYWCW